MTNWSAGTIYYLQSGSANSTTVETYNGALLLRIPIFNGFALQYDLLRARADAEAANASRDSLTQDVVSQVWTSYYGVKTAEKRVETSRDLLESAGQSYEVTLGRYKAGVGSILDLLTSQAALDDARAQRAQAQADWRLALVQLSHDTGTLDVSPPTGDQGAP